MNMKYLCQIMNLRKKKTIVKDMKEVDFKTVSSNLSYK